MNDMCAACFADVLGADFCPCPGSSLFRIQHALSRPMPVIVHDLGGEVLFTVRITAQDEIGDLRTMLKQFHQLEADLSFGQKMLRDDTKLMDLRRVFVTTSDDVLHVQVAPRPPGLDPGMQCAGKPGSTI